MGVFLLILLWIYPLRILYICFFYVDVFVFVVLVFVVLNTPKVNMFVVFCYFFLVIARFRLRCADYLHILLLDCLCRGFFACRFILLLVILIVFLVPLTVNYFYKI